MGMGRPSGISSQAQGPPGANLFIYHLPTHYTDGDLLTLFSPFGQILSVKVFLDKMTMVSKGFGASIGLFPMWVPGLSYPQALSATRRLIRHAWL